MDEREAVWRAALTLSHSDSYQDRADAARCLAPFAGTGLVDVRLVELVCDVDNTFVTEAAVESLLKRRDPIGWRVVAQAYEREEDEHVRLHMQDAVRMAYGSGPSVLADIRRILKEATRGASPAVEAGANALIAELASLEADRSMPIRRSRWRRTRRD